MYNAEAPLKLRVFLSSRLYCVAFSACSAESNSARGSMTPSFRWCVFERTRVENVWYESVNWINAFLICIAGLVCDVAIHLKRKRQKGDTRFYQLPDSFTCLTCIPSPPPLLCMSKRGSIIEGEGRSSKI